MSDPGLSHRLRQRSRRAGFMIGISMILTIALCAVGFTVLYTALDGLTSDFISRTEEEPTVPAQVVEDAGNQPAEQPPPAEATEAAPPPEQQQQDQQEADPTPTPTAEDDTAEDGEFDADYEIGGNSRINLREGPSTATGIIDTLDPGTPLEYMDEDAPTESAADGERWMMFATEDGQEGWVREIDVNQIQ
jgi:hypothetical protein